MAGTDELVIQINEENFATEVLESDRPVLLDFWAVWCGPCKMIAPIVREVATAYEGRLKVGKVDVDHCQQVAARYMIRNLPTLLVFKDGQVVTQIVGAVPKAKVVAAVEEAL